MSPPQASLMLVIYLNANETRHFRALYRVAVEAARARHMAGASVFPVELSYGAHRRFHDAASEYTSFDIPVVVELVDAPEKLASFLDDLGPLVGEGLIHVRPVRVHHPAGAADSAGTGHRTTTGGGATPMRIEGEAQRVTVYIGSSDTWHGQNLAVALVERCRALGMAGATASRGIMGFGGNSVIHRAHLLGLSEDLPEKIEVIDRAEQVERLLPILDEMIRGGLIVVEDVRVVRHVHEPAGR